MRKILLLHFVLLLLYTCASIVRKAFTPPKVSIEKIRLEDVSYNGATMLLDIAIENPNKVGITLQNLKYKIFVNEEILLSGEREEKTPILAEKKNIHSFPFMIYYKGLKQGISTVLSKTSLPFRFEGNLGLLTPIGALNFDLKQEGDIPIPKLPSLEIEKVSVEEMSLTKTLLTFYILVKNNEDLSLDIKKIRYRIQIQGEEITRLESEVEKNLDGKKDFRLKIPVELKFLSLRRGILESLKSGKFHYQIDFELNLDSLYGPYSLPFQKEALTSLY